VRRIAALGDSITFGNRLALEDTWPHQLGELLAGEGVQVMNLGVGGYRTSQEVAMLKHVGLGLDPDLVVVGFCLNDLGDVSPNLQYIERAARYGESPWYRARIAQFVQVWIDHLTAAKRDFEFLDAEPASEPLGPEIEALQSELRESLTGLDDPPQFLGWYATPYRVERLRHELAALGAIARAHELPVVVVVVPYLEDHPLYQLAYRILELETERAGFHYVSVYDAFRAGGFENLQRGEKGDSVHPNRAGHAILARALEAKLREIGWLANNGDGAAAADAAGP
jgi:lysophospholipase L1-like esterase